MAVPDAYADLLGAIHTDNWASQANCIGLAHILEDPDREDEAKALCAGCPVIRQCLSLSINVHPKVDVDGISAGRTKKERDTARRRYTRANKRRAALTVLDAGDSKPCNQCGDVKPLTDYYVERRTPSGRRGTCKTCTRENQRTAAAHPKPVRKEIAA